MQLDELEFLLLIRIHSLKHLPEKFSSKLQETTSFGAQCVLNGVRKGSALSVWGRNARAREVFWMRGADEMCWKFKDRDFKAIKQNHPKAKVFIYSTSASEKPSQSNSISLGYFLIDLRDLQATPIKEQWVKLKNTKHTEVQFSASLQFGKRETVLEQEENRENEHKDEGIKISVKGDALQIGAGTSNGHIYLLSITIQSAGNLSAIIPPETFVQGEGSFWLSYEAFDVITQTDKFRNIENADFEPLIDTFRLKGKIQDLAAYFNQHLPALQIFLCSENQILGAATAHLARLLPIERWSFGEASAFVGSQEEGKLLLHSPTLAAQPDPQLEESKVFSENSPFVEVKMELMNITLQEQAAQAMLENIGQEEEETSTTQNLEADVQSLSLKIITLIEIELDSVDDEEEQNRRRGGLVIRLAIFPENCSELRHIECGDYGEIEAQCLRDAHICVVGSCLEGGVVDCTHASTGEVFARGQLKYEDLAHKGLHSLFLESVSEPGKSIGKVTIEVKEDDNDPRTIDNTVPTAPEVPLVPDTVFFDSGPDTLVHGYRLTIHLVSIRGLENASYLLCAFHYPHLGSSAPTRTGVTWVLPQIESSLKNSVCLYELATRPAILNQVIRDNPLMVSVRKKDKFVDEEIGVVCLPLEGLLDSRPKFFRCPLTQKTFEKLSEYRSFHRGRSKILPPVYIRVLDSYLTVFAVSTSEPCRRASGKRAAPERVCALRAKLTLEDFGVADEREETFLPIQSRPPAPAPKENPFTTSPDFKPPTEEGIPGISNIADANQQARRNAEWEEWRMKEEEAWMCKLKEKDAALEQRWQDKEKATLQLLAKGQAEIAALETKLRKALAEIDAKQRALVTKESDSAHAHAQKLSELQLMQRRVREEAKHQVDLERIKVSALETRLANLEKQLQAAEERARQAEDDFNKYRESHRKTPEAALRTEIVKLQAEKAEANAQMERERAEKHKALLEKEEFRSHVHRLARALKREQDKQATIARKEMENLRLEYVAREERYQLDGERQQLELIKNELNNLRQASALREMANGHSKAAANMFPTDHKWQGKLRAQACDESSECESEISRLKEERRELLATGTYTVNHPIIKQLDSLILQGI